MADSLWPTSRLPSSDSGVPYFEPFAPPRHSVPQPTSQSNSFGPMSRWTRTRHISQKLWRNQTKTDATGTFGFCGIPAGAAFEIQATGDSASSGSIHLTTGTLPLLRRDLLVGSVVETDSTRYGAVAGISKERIGSTAPGRARHTRRNSGNSHGRERAVRDPTRPPGNAPTRGPCDRPVARQPRLWTFCRGKQRLSTFNCGKSQTSGPWRSLPSHAIECGRTAGGEAQARARSLRRLHGVRSAINDTGHLRRLCRCTRCSRSKKRPKVSSDDEARRSRLSCPALDRRSVED